MTTKRQKPSTPPGDWSTLKDKWFHTFNEEGYVQYQGQIIELVNQEIAMVQLYEWAVGAPRYRKAVWVRDIVDNGWALYASDEALRESYELGFVKSKD